MRAGISGGFNGKRRRFFWTLAGIMAGVLILALGCVYGVYQGYVHVNGLAAGKYPVRGIDVSHYQGEIDWETMAGQGIDFAYIKATEGSSHGDEKFVQNMTGARAAGVPGGVYHFFSFDSPGASQAEYFMTAAGAFEGMMVPAVDVEFYGNKKENPPDAEAVELQLRDFLDMVESACGRKPVIYATREVWEIYIRGRFEEYPLWIRDIWREPDMGSDSDVGVKAPQEAKLRDGWAGENGWTFWQYTNRGRMDGFSGDEEFVDLNVFFGTREQWNQWLGE